MKARRRSARERGAIYTEALIVLPVIGLVASLIAFVHRGFDRALDAGTDVRGAAWVEARGGCVEETSDEVERRARDDFFGGTERVPGAVVAARADLGRRQPRLADRHETLSFSFRALRWWQSGSLTRGEALGGEARFGHHVDLPCDERHREVNLGAWILAAAVAP